MASARSRPEPIEVEPGDAAQPRGGVGKRLDPAAPFRDRLGHRALEDRDEQVVLAPEIEVDGARREAGRAGDVRDLRVEVAARGEGVDGRPQQRVSLVAAVGFRGESAGSRATAYE